MHKNYRFLDLKSNRGRSMLEMLGTLAIIGILSLGGLFGYKIAMTYYKANETIHDVMLRATNVPMKWSNYDDKNVWAGEEYTYPELMPENINPVSYPVEVIGEPKEGLYLYRVEVSNVPTEVCKRILSMKPTDVDLIKVGVEAVAGARGENSVESDCDLSNETTIKMAYYFDGFSENKNCDLSAEDCKEDESFDAVSCKCVAKKCTNEPTVCGVCQKLVTNETTGCKECKEVKNCTCDTLECPECTSYDYEFCQCTPITDCVCPAFEGCEECQEVKYDDKNCPIGCEDITDCECEKLKCGDCTRANYETCSCDTIVNCVCQTFEGCDVCQKVKYDSNNCAIGCEDITDCVCPSFEGCEACQKVTYDANNCPSGCEDIPNCECEKLTCGAGACADYESCKCFVPPLNFAFVCPGSTNGKPCPEDTPESCDECEIEGVKNGCRTCTPMTGEKLRECLCPDEPKSEADCNCGKFIEGGEDSCNSCEEPTPCDLFHSSYTWCPLDHEKQYPDCGCHYTCPPTGGCAVDEQECFTAEKDFVRTKFCCPLNMDCNPAGYCDCPPNTPNKCGAGCKPACPSGQTYNEANCECECPQGETKCGNVCCPAGQRCNTTTNVCECKSGTTCGNLCCSSVQTCNTTASTSVCSCTFGEDSQGNCCSEEVTPAMCASGTTKQDGDCIICATCEDMGMTTCASLCCDNGCDDTGNACKSACEDTVCPNGIAVKNYITGKDGPQNCVCCNNSNGETYVGAIDGQCCGGEAGFKTEMTPTYTVEQQYSYSLTSDSGDHCCSTAVTETHNMSDGSTTSSRTLCFGSTCEC